MTRPFLGTILTAVRQSVGRGWRPGGTPSIQIRHMPAGGRCPGGIEAFPRHCAAAGAALARVANAAKAKILLIRESPPLGGAPHLKAHTVPRLLRAGLDCKNPFFSGRTCRSSAAPPELKHDHPGDENQDADPRASRLLNDCRDGDGPAGE